MTQVKSEFSNNPDLKETFGAAILASLKSYSLRHTKCEDGSNYPLVDALTPPEELNIKLGQDELKLLADHLYSELENVFSAMTADKAAQPNGEGSSPKDVREDELVLSHDGVMVLPHRRKVSQDTGEGSEWNAAIDELIRLNPNKPNTVKVMRWLPRNPTASMSEAGRHACGYLGFCPSGDAAHYIWNQMAEAFERRDA